ncbi:MAG: uracil-DNA glycosylase [Oscillospiraceae bacterium]|nr:uracil-DNA glycosylase [Oscillospiraceae bacterium]
MVHIGNDWDEILAADFASESYQRLRQFLIQEYRTKRIYPDMYDIFNALKFTPYSAVKCVILGQDPYHGEGQAHGLSFSVRQGIQPPPSLVNIFKEIYDDTGIDNRSGSGDLTHWAEQGVLLLNAALTVRAGAANSHHGMGWEQLTDAIIRHLNEREQPMAFLLWGGNARAKASLITNRRHLILQCPHPSPLSAYHGFFGCRHFSKTNAFLTANGMTPIDWRVAPDGNSLREPVTKRTR